MKKIQLWLWYTSVTLLINRINFRKSCNDPCIIQILCVVYNETNWKGICVDLKRENEWSFKEPETGI